MWRVTFLAKERKKIFSHVVATFAFYFRSAYELSRSFYLFFVLSKPSLAIPMISNNKHSSHTEVRKKTLFKSFGWGQFCLFHQNIFLITHKDKSKWMRDKFRKPYKLCKNVWVSVCVCDCRKSPLVWIHFCINKRTEQRKKINKYLSLAPSSYEE